MGTSPVNNANLRFWKSDLTWLTIPKRVPAVFLKNRLRPSQILSASLTLSVCSLISGSAGAATGLSEATVTKVENTVNYGEVRSGRTAKRPAVANDVIRPNNFLLTEVESRAELKYEDGSVVRIGQNTVFSFDASTRTLSLDKGSLIFYIPKTSGGGTIKTPSLTAAITGTVGKVSDNIIAILTGEVTLVPSGTKVGAGEFARRNADGSITVAKFDMAKAYDGKLMNFNGQMPGFDESLLLVRTALPGNISSFDSLDRAQNLPGSLKKFFPELKPQEKKKNKPEVTPPPTPTPVPVRIPPRVKPSPTPGDFAKSF